MRAIISGGGTGGHIFPAIAIATALKEKDPGCEILFVGAQGRMEMEKIPAAGYRIIGLPVAGLKRSLSLSNLKLPFKIAKSVKMAKSIIKEFKPDVAIGVGGYASAPLLWAAQRLSIPTLIQEQNSYAGLTNKIIGKKADRICVAYPGMERFFPKDRITVTGNPVRSSIHRPTEDERREALSYYSLEPLTKTVFIVGGSLGSATLNNSVKSWIESGCPGGEGIQLIWQCGKYYINDIDAFMGSHPECKARIKHFAFIDRMDLAYAVADLIISRAGASTISELCIAGKAVIFVPSPNVTEDHQTHNAMALVNAGAGKIITDAEAPAGLMKLATGLVKDDTQIKHLEGNILKLARPSAAEDIAGEVFSLYSRTKDNKRHCNAKQR